MVVAEKSLKRKSIPVSFPAHEFMCNFRKELASQIGTPCHLKISIVFGDGQWLGRRKIAFSPWCQRQEPCLIPDSGAC